METQPLSLKTYQVHAQRLLDLATGCLNGFYPVANAVWFSNGTFTISSEPYISYIDTDGLLKERTWLLRFLHTDPPVSLFLVELVSCVRIVTDEWPGERASWETWGLRNQMPIAFLLVENQVPFCQKVRDFTFPKDLLK